MNQIKIGKFIAERRKCVNLTQAQLAEKLNITDRAVSKWENGKAMPDSSIMIELCSILKITVTDLLTGELVKMENRTEELEKQLLETIKQKESTDKKLLGTEIYVGIISTIILLVPIFLGAYLPMSDWKRVVVMLSGVIPAFAGFFVALRIEQVAGYYECKHCGHKYVPTYKQVKLAMHMGRTRYMKCPNCGKKSWQKKVISKD